MGGVTQTFKPDETLVYTLVTAYKESNRSGTHASRIQHHICTECVTMVTGYLSKGKCMLKLVMVDMTVIYTVYFLARVLLEDNICGMQLQI